MYWQQISREQEQARLLKEFEHKDFDQLMGMCERQFSVLHNRAQVMLTLCGIVVTLTGFSGRNIAGTSRPAQICVIIGLSVTLLAAFVIVWYVLHLHWLTAQLGDDRAAWLRRCLQYRDRKTMALRVGTRLLIVGLIFYAVAVAIMLLHPEATLMLPR